MSPLLQTLKNKNHRKFFFYISIHQNIIIATKNLAKPAYETSIVRCIPEIVKYREIQNLFWKLSGSVLASFFRTNKRLDNSTSKTFSNFTVTYYLPVLQFFALIMNSTEFLNYMTLWRANKFDSSSLNKTCTTILWTRLFEHHSFML